MGAAVRGIEGAGGAGGENIGAINEDRPTLLIFIFTFLNTLTLKIVICPTYPQSLAVYNLAYEDF